MPFKPKCKNQWVILKGVVSAYEDSRVSKVISPSVHQPTNQPTLGLAHPMSGTCNWKASGSELFFFIILSIYRQMAHYSVRLWPMIVIRHISWFWIEIQWWNTGQIICFQTIGKKDLSGTGWHTQYVFSKNSFFAFRSYLVANCTLFYFGRFPRPGFCYTCTSPQQLNKACTSLFV